MRLPFLCPWLLVLSVVACGPTDHDGDLGAARSAGADGVVRPPRKLAKLSTQEGTVAIAVDDTHAYVTTRRDDSGSIVKVPLAGGAYEVLAAMQPAPFAIAVDDSGVYFTVRDTGRVHRVGKNGGAVSVVAEQHERANGAEAIALDATHVYWSAVGGIFRATKSGVAQSAELLAEDNEGADALAVDGGEAFWIARGTAGNSDGGLYKVAVTGGEKIALGMGDIFRLTSEFSIAAKGGFVFVPDTARGRVYRVHHSTGELGLVAEGQDVPIALAADERRVYWSTGGAAGARSEYRSLSAAPINGGSVERLVSTREANVFAIATNGRGVYFTDYVSTGSIYAAAP